MSWRRTVEPYASAWAHLLYRAQSGFVHALEALPILQQPVPGKLPLALFPSDVADLLADMVHVGVLEPIKCTPCADQELWRSLCAFRGLSGSAGGALPIEWSPTEAHLFGYQLPTRS